MRMILIWEWLLNDNEILADIMINLGKVEYFLMNFSKALEYMEKASKMPNLSKRQIKDIERYKNGINKFL